MRHIGMRVYLTAIAMFVSSLLARSTGARGGRGARLLPNSKHRCPVKLYSEDQSETAG